MHGAAATPEIILDALITERNSLNNVEMIHLHTHGRARYADYPEFRVTNLFVGENLRKKLDYDRVDYLPCFLSEIPGLFRRRVRAPDVAIVQVSSPDAKGYCSLGTSIDVARAAVESASIVLGQVNPEMPRTHGDGLIHLKQFTSIWEHRAPLLATQSKIPNATEKKIAEHVATLVENGSTLQMGIGAIPDAVWASLTDRKNLGVHTEMFSDGLLPLLECGAVDNSKKTFHAGKTVTSFVNGTDALFRYVHDNPSILFLESDYVNRAENIARNPKVMAINSAVEVDLTGQVVADSIGCKIISGVGGQMDFVRGASQSEGGKAVIALQSRTRSGRSRIVSMLHPGAGVVTTRAHVHFIVTEYGIADLYGRTLGERAKALIEIAHPQDRESLARSWFERDKLAP